MTAPRPLNDGAKVGWGLLAFIITVCGVIITAAAAVAASVWKRLRRD